MTKGRLGKSEKYVIEGMFEDGHSFDEIAKETGRTAGTIEKHLRTTADTETANGKVEDEKPKPKGKNKGLFVRQTSAKKDKGVSIMTEAESSRGEESGKKSQSKIKKRFLPTLHTIDRDKKD